MTRAKRETTREILCRGLLVVVGDGFEIRMRPTSFLSRRWLMYPVLTVNYCTASKLPEPQYDCVGCRTSKHQKSRNYHVLYRTTITSIVHCSIITIQTSIVVQQSDCPSSICCRCLPSVVTSSHFYGYHNESKRSSCWFF